MNGALLWRTGRIVERRVGSLRMFALYMAGVLAGGAAILLKDTASPHEGVSLGASAAVSALLSASLVLLYRPGAARFGQALWVRITLWVLLLGGLAISFLPGVSLAGHLGGLAVGALLGAFIPLRRLADEDQLQSPGPRSETQSGGVDSGR
jgi:membrane associated rhomboid family serine protease